MSDEFKAWLREICERHCDALEEIGWVEKKKPPYIPVEMRTLVEVVRCEECAIRYTACPMVIRMSMAGVIEFFTKDDDYCSYGRRSDE